MMAVCWQWRCQVRGQWTAWRNISKSRYDRRASYPTFEVRALAVVQEAA